MPTLIVAYDITNNKTRRRLHKLLRGYGQAHQESVFVCDLTAAQANRMWEDITALGPGEKDLVSAFPVNGNDYRRARYINRQQRETEPEWFV